MIKDQNAMIEETTLDIDILRKKFPDIEAIYKYLVDQEKKYMPEWKNPDKRPKWISENYLRGVMFENYFSITEDKIKNPPRPQIKKSKQELVAILAEIGGRPLGFEPGKYPSKEWLRTVIFSLKPEHDIFSTIKTAVVRKVPKE